jgi:hypothetical protein
VSEIVATNSESVSTRATRMLEIAAAEDGSREVRVCQSASARKSTSRDSQHPDLISLAAECDSVDLVEREVSEIVATNSESVSTRATRMLEIAAAEESKREREKVNIARQSTSGLDLPRGRV